MGLINIKDLPKGSYKIISPTPSSSRMMNVRDIPPQENMNFHPKAKKDFSFLGSVKEGLSDAYRGIGDAAMGAINPFLKVAGSGLRAIESIPALARGDITESQKIASKPIFSQQTLEGSSNLENLGTAAEVGLTLLGGKAGGKVIKSPTQKIVDNLAKSNTLTGRIVQGTASDVSKAKSVLGSVNTKEVKSYKDLTNILDEQVKTLSKKQDTLLSSDTRQIKLPDLKMPSKVGQATIKPNYVKDAITQLKAHYKAIRDFVGEAKVKELEFKAQSKGLTIKEINNLARMHGNDLNAFNANGQAASGITKQAAENTRSGVKSTVRNLFGKKESEQIDTQISDTIRTRDLVEKVAENVTKLQQKIVQRGFGEEVGRLAFKVADKLTGGGLKGFVQSFVPRGEGLKIMNALDLERGLQKNLKELQGLLDSNISKQNMITRLKNILR